MPRSGHHTPRRPPTSRQLGQSHRNLAIDSRCRPPPRCLPNLSCVQFALCRIALLYFYQGGALRRAAGPASAAGSALGGPPAARRAALVTTLDRIGYRHDADARVPSSSLSIVQLAATAYRAALRAVAVIGCADPRYSAHSQGFGACEEDGGRIGNVGGSVTRHRAEARADPLAER